MLLQRLFILFNYEVLTNMLVSNHICDAKCHH